MSEATATLQCATVRADRWSQLPGLEYTGRLGLQVPPQIGGEMQLIVGDALPLQLEVATPDGRDLPVATDALMAGPGQRDAAGGLLAGRRPAGERAADDQARARARVSGAHGVGVRSPGPPRAAGAGEADWLRQRRARTSVCRTRPARTVLFANDRREEPVSLENDEVFGTGWYGDEGRGAQAFRWTSTDAVVLLSSALRTDVTVTMEAEAAAGAGRGDAEAPLLTLRVNGVDIATQPMGQGRQPYKWNVPAGVWLAGTNELWWHTSRAVRPADMGGTDTRTLALRVSSIVVGR